MRQPTTDTKVYLAGALAVEHLGRRTSERDLPGRQPRLAFGALVWNHGRTIPHEELADILWPSQPPATWQTALRGLIAKTRAAFDIVGLDGATTVSSQPGCYRLDLPPGTVVDVKASIAHVAEAGRFLESGDVETARRLASEARSVLSRPLLAGIDSPWLDRRRDELSTALAHSLEILGECRRRAGEYVHAAQVVEELLKHDPFRETAWRLLMRIHRGSGNVGEALRAYERCRTMLAEELGTDPAPETQELHTRILRDTSAPPAAPAPTEEPPAAVGPRVAGPPYRGLRHFDEEDAAIFFGRDGEIAGLVERLRGHRFVAAVGPSGSGKTSLVRAGLLPALRSGALPDSDVWQRLVLVPGAQPLDALGAALRTLDPDPNARDAIARLDIDETALHAAVRALLAGRPAAEQLLLVVDQFEEMFTLCHDEDMRRRFVAALLHATRQPDSRLVVVATLRADFFAHAATIPDLAELLSTSQMVVPPLDGDGLQRAIEGPAGVARLRLEDGLTGRIVGDVAGQPGALPFLQHALLELFERRTDRVLTRVAYDDIGGVSGALSRRAEDIWAGLTGEQQVVAQRVLLRLTQPGEGTEDTRRRVQIDELTGDHETATERVVDELVHARLLVTSADPATGERSVEIAHEALLGGWPRLAGWIEDDRAGLRVHRRLTGDARQWADHDRHPDFLLSGARLAEVRGWSVEHEHDPNPLERDFVDASVRAEQAGERRRARIRRIAMTGMAAGLVAVAVLALLAVVARDRADREGDLAHSREIAAEAANQLPIDPELALLLAIEAYQVAPTSQATAALRQGLVRSTLLHRLPTEGSDPHVEVSPDGELVATAQVEGPISIWRTATGEHVADLVDAAGSEAMGVIKGLSFSPDGSKFIASTLDGAAWIWSLPGGKLVRSITWPKQGKVVYVIVQEGTRWSPDGARVVVAGLDGRARLFDPDSGRLLATLNGPGAGGDFLARALFTPDGRRIAVEGARGAVRVLDAKTRDVVSETKGHGEHLWSMKISADGKRLVTAGEDGTARIWDIATGRRLAVLRHDGEVRDVAISPDGRRVLVGDARGVGRIWDAATGEARFDLTGHDERANQVRFDPEGRLALTASIDGTVRVWDAASGDVLAVLTGSTQPVTDAEFTPDGKFIVTAGDDPRIWRVPRAAESVIEAHDAPVHDLAISADGTRLVTGGWSDGKARIWNLTTGKVLAEIPHQTGTQLWVDISADGRRAVTTPAYGHGPGQGNPPEPPRIWDVETGDMVLELSHPIEDPFGVCGGKCAASDAAFDPAGKRIAVGGFDGRIRIFDARTGALVTTTVAGDAAGWSIDWRPDGKAVLGTSFRGSGSSAMSYDSTTGKKLHTTPSAPQALQAGKIAFDTTGRLAATNFGAVSRIYEMDTERLFAELRHRGAVRDISFSSDNALVVTSSVTRATIWDLASQRRLVELPGSKGSFSTQFGPNDEIIVGGADGAVRFYECEVCQPVDDLLELARQRVTRDLTPVERARFLHE